MDRTRLVGLESSAPCNALRRDLSRPMLDALWTLAQHKYGWGYESNLGRHLTVGRTMLALERRGLVALVEDDRLRPWQLLEAARPLIAELWPVTPWGLGTYEHQPGGWSRRDSHPDRKPGGGEAVAPNPETGCGA